LRALRREIKISKEGRKENSMCMEKKERKMKSNEKE
jgi:hypothetical protein